MTVRVAFLMPGVGVEPRGAEAFVVELSRALAGDRRFDVELLCRRPSNGDVRQRQVRAVSRDAGWLNRIYSASRLSRKLLDTFFLDPLNVEWATASASAFPTLWRQRYDVIVVEGGLVGAWLCRLIRRLRGTPFVDIAHGMSAKWEGAFARQRPNCVVTFTETAARQIAALAPRTRIEIIPHGVDLDLFSPEGRRADLRVEAPIVLTAGAVDRHKRFELAVEALARRGSGSLLVLGDGPEGDALDRLAMSRLGPTRYLRTQVPRREMPTYYRAASVFVLPSVSEAFGLVYLEALACGLPCVAPDDAVRREVIGPAGLFCKPEDTTVFADKIGEALGQAWGDLPRRRATEFAFRRTAERYAQLFEELGS